MTTRVAVNGRFMLQPITGVQRYAHELTRRLADRIDVIRPAHEGRLTGNLWEQAALPLRAAGRVLWSPANTGPLAATRHVVTIHDASALDHPEWFDPAFSRWYGFLLPRLARRALHVLTDSAFSRARLIARTGVPEHRITVVPCGVDERFRPADDDAVADLRARMDLPRPYVLAVGSLEPRKNLAALFRAWEAARPRIPDVELVVAGAGGSVFRSLGFDHAPPGVRLIGYCPDDDLPTLFSGARAFVFPSLYEGFGLPVLEAMACGTPVITSRAASLPEVAGGAAVLIDPRDTGAIEDALVRVLGDDALRADLRDRGIARAAGFRWADAADRVWRILSACAEAGP